ncbi:hypothetical protein QAD02_012902 [Eretmocerus hayati]|uniref:Uncharacterized protein n=1 Tax=Eretmocerus hayati TaxID=131215 RepID=A0ACC2P5S9_9HYME|nr:hypothetical protein QAD02_012902 [Eretmocerus hayati]
MLEKAFKDDVFNTVDLLTIVHDVVSSCGMKNSLIAKRILGAIEHLEMVEADESNLVKACAMAENEARAGSEKSADTVILAALNDSVYEQETSAGEIQVSEKSDGITLLDSITDPTGVEVRHVIDTEENSIVDLTQSVGSNYNIVSSDNAHVLEQRDTSPSPLADPSVSDEDIVADVTKNNTDHASTASDLASENLEDSQACVPISSRKRSIVSEDEMLEEQSVSGKRARIEEAIDSAKNDDTTINGDISDENNREQNCHLPSEPLGHRCLYFDTDSLLYYTDDETREYVSETGCFLGNLTNELETYGPNSFIKNFASGGPKFYAYVVQKDDGEEIEVCKVKGITLNYKTKKLVNYNRLRRYIQGEVESPLIIEYDGIRRTEFHDVVTRRETKTCKPVYKKRWFMNNELSYPYGYKQNDVQNK